MKILPKNGRDLPSSGQVYRHFKGDLYEIIDVGTHTETGEALVVYERFQSFDKAVWIRPLEMFMDVVEGCRRFVLDYDKEDVDV